MFGSIGVSEIILIAGIALVIMGPERFPDFVKMAISFGAAAYLVDSPKELAKILPRALEESGPTIIEVALSDRMPSPWQFILMEQNRKALCT